MLNLDFKKLTDPKKMGVLMALLAVVFVSAAFYVYRARLFVSEGFDGEAVEDDDEVDEGFENFAPFE